jgi:hypothetical protein
MGAFSQILDFRDSEIVDMSVWIVVSQEGDYKTETEADSRLQ